MPEIEQALQSVGEWSHELIFMTHSLPVARGIFASIYCETKNEMSANEAGDMFADFYRDSFFVRLVERRPRPNWVKTTNFAISGSLRVDGSWSFFTALDNLVKEGAARPRRSRTLNLMVSWIGRED